MISDDEVHALADFAPVLWVTGLSGVGKSTLARALVASLRDAGERPLLLDGDKVREVLDEADASTRHDIDARRKRAWRLARLANFAARQQVPVVVATISLFSDVQEWNRSSNGRYAEILLSAPIETLRKRNPGRYPTVAESSSPNVIGLDLQPEYPVSPELTLDQRFIDSDLDAHVRQALGLWRSLTQCEHAGP